ncbi:hypothetical protein [Cellulomonas sp. ATA003]|uniref:hypothetical protein n=1 Tax=Cellulomonas sp. ATA003 TaxID=3073064 RepID=UPI0037C06BC8
MASTSRRSRPVRTLVTLAVLVAALFGALAAGTRWSDAGWAPELALDLEGGTQLILTPVAEGGEEITDETITQAIAIIRQRVDSSGVAEAEITSQGGTNIVVGLPGTPSEETLDLVRTSAQMRFRPVLTITAPTPFPVEEAPAGSPAWRTPPPRTPLRRTLPPGTLPSRTRLVRTRLVRTPRSRRPPTARRPRSRPRRLRPATP